MSCNIFGAYIFYFIWLAILGFINKTDASWGVQVLSPKWWMDKDCSVSSSESIVFNITHTMAIYKRGKYIKVIFLNIAVLLIHGYELITGNIGWSIITVAMVTCSLSCDFSPASQLKRISNSMCIPDLLVYCDMMYNGDIINLTPVFICEQNVTVRLSQKARDHLHPAEETRSPQ